MVGKHKNGVSAGLTLFVSVIEVSSRLLGMRGPRGIELSSGVPISHRRRREGEVRVLLVLSDQDRKISKLPDESSAKPRRFQPDQLVADSTGLVVHAVNGRDSFTRIIWNDDIGEHEASAWTQNIRNSSKEIGFSGLVQVMHRQRRDNEFVLAFRQRILEPRNPKVSVRQTLTGVLEHHFALVDSDEMGTWMLSEHSYCCLACSDTELKNALYNDVSGRLSGEFLQGQITGDFSVDHVPVRRWIEVELARLVSRLKRLTHSSPLIRSGAHGKLDQQAAYLLTLVRCWLRRELLHPRIIG